MNPEPTRVLVSMPDRFLKAVDTFAYQEQVSRSKLVREALSEYMMDIRRKRREGI